MIAVSFSYEAWPPPLANRTAVPGSKPFVEGEGEIFSPNLSVMDVMVVFMHWPIFCGRLADCANTGFETIATVTSINQRIVCPVGMERQVSSFQLLNGNAQPWKAGPFWSGCVVADTRFGPNQL
jgi:hypothetical protein